MEKFNLIIPTRERADSLLYTLSTVVKLDYDNLNILVSDNYSQDNTREVVESFRDERIHYVNTGRRLSMAGNYEFALSNVNEGWVSYLGDDDAVLPNAVSNLVMLAIQADVDAVSSSIYRFSWGRPEVNLPGILHAPKVVLSEIKDSRLELQKLLSGEGCYATSYSELPWVYHGGAVKMEVINRAKSTTGSFFLSPIPDVYSAIAISRVTKRYLRIGEPFFISGNSRHSIGVSQTRFFASSKQKREFAKFVEEFEIPFDQQYVLGKSLPIIVYEAARKSEFLGGGVAVPDLDKQLQVALKFSGKNLPFIFLEVYKILMLNNRSFSLDLVTGLFSWLKYNIKKVGQSSGKRYVLANESTVVDAVSFIQTLKG